MLMVLDRRMNRMDSDTHMVHLRLEAWGRWAHEHSQAWPAVTLLGRIADQGANGASQTTKPPICMPEPIAQIDAAVAKLGAIDQRVIVTYYTRWQPLEVMAKQHHVRVSQFQNILRRARWRLILMLNQFERNADNMF